MPVQRKTGRRPPPSWTTLLGVLLGLLAVAAPVVWLLAGSGHTGEADPAEIAAGFRTGPAPDPTMPAVDTAAGPPTAPVTTTTAPVPDPTAPEPTAGTPSSATTTTAPVSDPTAPTSSARTASSLPADTHPAPSTTSAPAMTATTSTAPTATVVRRSRSITIAATGDLIIHKAVARTARTADGWDFTPMFSQVREILRAADLAVCHLETPMSPDNKRISSYPRFNVPNELADAIAHAGYDTCSLASNHSADTGLRGVIGTIEALDRAGVAHTGMARTPDEQERLNLVEVKGATVAHLSYTYGLNIGELRAEEAHMVNIVDEQAILEEAGRARAAGAEFIILSLHWGTEYSRAPDRYQADLGPRLLSSPDIDLIIGHHAHVVQPVDRIGHEYLVYGLGNFLSNQSPRWEDGKPGTQDGVILQFTVTRNPSTGRWSLTSIEHTPTRVNVVTFEIVNALKPGGERNRAALAASAAETARALAALGTRTRAIPGPATGAAEWLFHLLDGPADSRRS